MKKTKKALPRQSAKPPAPGRSRFWKYQSEGNDFVILETAAAKHRLETTSHIKALAHRIHGIGANGVIFMQKKAKGWHWRFYNEDGSTAKMCGNGAKCIALWLKNNGGNPRDSQWQWQSALGTVRSEMAGSLMWVTWPIADLAPKQEIITELGEILDGLNERGLAYIAAIDVGIPHLVLVNHESWTSTDRAALNEQLRHHPIFGKAGTNVSWHSLSTGESVTFERGVEAETLACGTGAIAIFKALEDMGRTKSRSVLKFPGGSLHVKRERDRSLWLGGKPREVFAGEI